MLTLLTRSLRLSAAGAALAASLGVSPANAVVFNWSFTAPGLSGGGTMDTTQDLNDPVQFFLNSISGQVNGSTITGLTGYGFPDQVVFYPNPPNIATTFAGFGFGVGGGMSYVIYEDFGHWTGTHFGCGAIYCIEGPGLDDNSGLFTSDPVVAITSLTLSAAVPEPSTWGLMLVGFAGLGFAGYRRARFAKTA